MVDVCVCCIDSKRDHRKWFVVFVRRYCCEISIAFPIQMSETLVHLVQINLFQRQKPLLFFLARRSACNQRAHRKQSIFDSQAKECEDCTKIKNHFFLSISCLIYFFHYSEWWGLQCIRLSSEKSTTNGWASSLVIADNRSPFETHLSIYFDRRNIYSNRSRKLKWWLQ